MDELWWQRGHAGRAGLVAGVGLVVVLTVVVGWQLTRTPKAVLFSDLSSGAAARVVSELERKNIDYSLTRGGKRIMVAADRVHQIRLDLVGSGVRLQGGVGFELFDKAELGMTEFAQRVNYQRALEGELTRTITSLSDVRTARVHLVLPKQGLFARSRKKPSASVILFLAPGASPGEGQVSGIQNLVAAAVPEMQPGDVKVSDNQGALLSRGGAEKANEVSPHARLGVKQEVEAYLQSKVEAVLKGRSGMDQVGVSVNAALDFERVERTRERLLEGGDGAQVTHRRETVNDPGAGENASGASRTTEVEYEYGREVERVVDSAGGIRRLTVGVLVPASMSPERRRSLARLVADTVGIEEQRGDSVSVTAVAGLADPSAAQASGPEVADRAERPAAGGGRQAAAGAGAGARTPEAETGWAPSMEAIAALGREGAVVVALVAVIVLLLVALVLSRARARRSDATASGARMSDEEREALLRRVREWLAEDTAAEPGREAA